MMEPDSLLSYIDQEEHRRLFGRFIYWTDWYPALARDHQRL
jgi:hypothetical protein